MFTIGMEIIMVVFAVLGIIVAAMAIKQVPQGEEWTVERFGGYTHTLRPGLRFIVPLIDAVGRRLIMMEQVLDIPSQEVISKDNAMVRVDGVIFFQIVDAVRAAYEVDDLINAIGNLVLTNIRTVMGSLDLDEMLSQRDAINCKLLAVVDDASAVWGIKVTRIEIKDITPPHDLVEAMAGQMKAERDKRAKILEAEGIRQALILQADGEKQSAILKAEAELQSAYREAEARERQAQAEAQATTLVSNAIEKGNQQAINYFVAQRYIEALQHIAAADNQKVIFMPLEASNVIGALGGITDLIKHNIDK